MALWKSADTPPDGIDEAIEYLADDELLEVTPVSWRIRKRVLNTASAASNRRKLRSFGRVSIETSAVSKPAEVILWFLLLSTLSLTRDLFLVVIRM